MVPYLTLWFELLEFQKVIPAGPPDLRLQCGY